MARDRAALLDGTPRVQVSLDLPTLDVALATADVAVRAGVDWLEAGTPLILGEGLHAVRALHERFPDHPVVADLKTMDAGYLEAEMMFRAGATFVVVMAVAHEHTVRDPQTGRAVTRDLADYHVPVHADVPAIDVILVDEIDPYVNEVGAKGLGEIGNTGGAAAIANAIFHATGKRIRDLPITPDKLL